MYAYIYILGKKTNTMTSNSNANTSAGGKARIAANMKKVPNPNLDAFAGKAHAGQCICLLMCFID